jgi:hypothetical protein
VHLRAHEKFEKYQLTNVAQTKHGLLWPNLVLQLVTDALDKVIRRYD